MIMTMWIYFSCSIFLETKMFSFHKMSKLLSQIGFRKLSLWLVCHDASMFGVYERGQKHRNMLARKREESFTVFFFLIPGPVSKTTALV